MMRRMRWLWLVPAAILALLAALFALLWPAMPPEPVVTDRPVLPATLARGEYLARIGDCQACHTQRGGPIYAGGRAIPTPFGTFYAPNLTPDLETGLGAWSEDDFWAAMHEGKSRDGSPLYPVFPYTNYTRIAREDSDAIWAYLRSLPPVRAPRRAHELHFPYAIRALLNGWRLLYFRPGPLPPDPAQSEEWNRGRYLAKGLGHCSACHKSRNALGAIGDSENPSGGLMLNWYAPTLESRAEAGVQDWSLAEIEQLLGSGHSARGSALGPMAEVVYESLQYLTPADRRAMAVFLKSLPDRTPAPARGAIRVAAAEREQLQQRGATVYEQHCASCHGERGEGHPPMAPALAGNRSLLLDSAVNPIRIVLFGGYPPGTEGNPRPYGMPPFVHTLSDDDLAAVLSYTRTAWGNEARPISPVEVRRYRAGPLW